MKSVSLRKTEEEVGKTMIGIAQQGTISRIAIVRLDDNRDR